MKKFTGFVVIKKPIELVLELFKDSQYYTDYLDGFIKLEVESGEEGKEACVSKLFFEYGDRHMILTETVLESNLPTSYKVLHHHEVMENTKKSTFVKIDDESTRYDFEFEYTRIEGFMTKLMFNLFSKSYKRRGEKECEKFRDFVEKFGQVEEVIVEELEDLDSDLDIDEEIKKLSE